ncbi:undecaprenyl-diphosphate phosphatase [Pseudomonadota bacterium]
MSLVQLIVLALIQGLTEYLPVSSSAHLILGSMVFSWPDQGLVVDTATHLGTLLAVLVYFRQDLADMILAWIRPVQRPADRLHRNMALYLVLASIPVLLVGALAHQWIELYLRDMRVVAWSTLVFGVLLGVAHLKGPQQKELDDFSLKSALLVGLAQALALIPGTSRSGVTITAARFLGFTADAAARFSFLLAIPVVAAAGLYSALKIASGESTIEWPQFFIAVGVSGVAGWVCIAAFLALLKRVGLMPFVIYRLALGALLLWIVS